MKDHQYGSTETDWLPEIPEHWDLIKAKRLFHDVSEQGYSEESLLSVTQEHGVIPRDELEDRVVMPLGNVDKYKLIEEGDFAISLRSFEGGIEYSQYRGLVSPSYTVLKTDEEVHEPYFRHLFKSSRFVDALHSISRGIRQGKTINYSDFGELYLPVPPEEEQRSIASQLDEKTGQIDKYIAKKRELIDLLETQRRAIINRAVTRGLDDGVEMKDSESRFFPSIPSHWEETQLKHLCHDIADGPHHSPNYVDDGIPFLSVRNVKVNGWDFDDLVYIDEENYEAFCDRVVPEYGDVLYTKGGTTGIAKAVDFDQRFQVWVHLAVLKVREELVDPFFLAYMLNSRGCYDQSQLYTRGAANQDLGLTRMARIDLLRPPLEEQKQIVNHIDERTSEIDDAIDQAERQIELMEQYRTSLVAEVVTGQVEVRDAVTV